MSIRENFSASSLLTFMPSTENRLSGGETLEVIIPDKYPDALEIVSLCGEPYLKGRDDSGSITLQTVYELSALVRAADGTVFPILSEIPVAIRSSLTFEEGSAVHASVYSISKEAHIVNSRKLAFSCEVGVSLTVWSPRKAEYLDVSSPDVILKKSEEALLRRSAAISEGFFISDELPLPAGKPAVSAIVSKSCRWKSEEQRLTSDKLIVRAMAALEVGYLSPDGEWNNASFELPFTRVFDLPSVDEDAPYFLRLRMGKITVIPQMREESAVLAITVAAEAQILCYENMTLTSIEDLYSLKTRFLPTYETISLPSSLINEEGQLTREEVIEFPHDPESIASFSLSLSPVSLYYKEEGQLHAEVTAHADFLYISDGKLCHLEKNFPVEWAFSAEGSVSGVTAEISSARYTLPAMRKSEITFSLDFHLSGEALFDLHTVKELKEEEDDSSSLPTFLYLARVGTRDLYSLGKAYHASPSEIAELNELDPSKPIPSGMPLLIPVFHGKS